VSSNSIRSKADDKGNGFLDLLPALYKSAESGSLEALDLQDNNMEPEEATDCLVKLLQRAKGLKVLKISDSMIEVDQQKQIISELPSVAKTLECLEWNFDL